MKSQPITIRLDAIAMAKVDAVRKKLKADNVWCDVTRADAIRALIMRNHSEDYNVVAAATSAPPVFALEPTPKKERKLSQQQELWRWMQAEREKKFGPQEDDSLPVAVLNTKLGEVLKQVGDVGAKQSWTAFLVSPFAATTGPRGALKVWLATWQRYKAEAQKPKQDYTKGVVRAETQDWSNEPVGIAPKGWF